MTHYMNNNLPNNLTDMLANAKEVTNTSNPVEEIRSQQQPIAQPVQENPNPAQMRPVLPPKDDDFVIPGPDDILGMIVNNEEIDKEQKKVPPTADQINPDTMENIKQYMQEMDVMIEQAKQQSEEKKQELESQKEEEPEDEDEGFRDPEEVAKELEEKYNEAVVIIDKLGMGSVINFTPEEREKLEHVKKIRLEEVETVNIKAFKTKKSKRNSLDKILKRQPILHSTPIVLPASGYTAVVRGCSTYELISLMSSTENPLIDAETKWSLIHSKLEDTSLGKMNFNDFLRATAAVDYNMFIYGILCATYPDDDKIPLKCQAPNCGKEFEHKYSVKSLIRAEKMSDKLKEMVANVIDHSHTEEMAKKVHEESPVNQVKAIKLPVSGIVMDLYVQSAYDLIYNSIKALQENKEEKYNQASVLSTVVKTAYVPDPDSDPNDPEYFEFSDAMDITKIIFSLTDKDILVLSKQSEVIFDDLTFEFGLMNVKCPHCGHYRETVPFDIESILFYRYQQAMNTTVE